MELTPSKLSRAHSSLVIDASVLINILGTGCPAAVLKCLCRVFAIDEIALREVNIDPSTRRSSEDILATLQSLGLLEVIRMGDDAYDRFLGFTAAQPPDDLDDGEAATLAHAACGEYVAVIDERKATRIASVHIPRTTILNSIDLLAAPEMLHQLGKDKLSDVIYRALRDARMRVPARVRHWIADLLGNPRAQECPSLGGCSPIRPERTS
jgi:hypothetical protein